MKSALKTTVAVFSVITAVAGIEHGIGEILQGSRAPDSWFIQSWPGVDFFSLMNGEPAMTVIPNLLATGILAILSTLAFLAWALFFVERRSGGLVLIGLSLIMLIFGAGFGPPLIGIILGIGALGMPTAAASARVPAGQVRRFLGRQWPWIITAGLAAWLLLFPGTNLIDHFFGMPEAALFAVIFSAFVLLLLALVTARARDRSRAAGEE